jgi:hypothetical protein
MVTELMHAAFAAGSQTVRSGDEQQEVVIRAARRRMGATYLVRSEEVDELEQTIRDAWPKTTYLRLVRSNDVLEAVGRAVAAATAETSGDSEAEILTRGDEDIETRGVRDKMREIGQAVIGEIDKVVGGVMGQVLGDVNQALRAAWAEPISRFLGDILVYQRNQEEIQQRPSRAISDHAPGWGVEEKPISVVAHSLGGVIAFDAATRNPSPLWIDGFVTFGSQAAFFEVLDPRQNLPRYSSGHPVGLPRTIARWTNLWEPLDVLAFAVGKVFRLSSGVSPTDLRVSHDLNYGLATHSAYWGSNELVEAIRQTVRF